VQIPSGATLRLVIISCAAFFYSFCVGGGIIHGTELADYAAGYAPPYFAMLWAKEDARSSRYWPSYHYGLWLWWLSFPVLQHYILKTRGRAGFPLAIAFAFLIFSPFLASILGWWFYEQLPDLR
jgi:hypothetical protein